MTNAQVCLLRRCIAACRHAQEAGDGEYKHEYELVEVGSINGVHPETARALVSMGLLEYAMPRNATQFTNDHVRLAIKWD